MFQKCDKCRKAIAFNEAYIAITYNLQKQTHDLATQQNVIDIKHSEIVMVFCGNCGNQHNAHKMTEAVNLKEVVYQEIPTPEISEVASEPELNKTKIKKKLSHKERMEVLRYPGWLHGLLETMAEENDISIKEAYTSIEDFIKYAT